MTEQIRPKVSEFIKQVAASDETGKSKSKIDTASEYNSLFDYLQENKSELNDVEVSTINRLLDAAKKLLGIKDEKTKTTAGTAQATGGGAVDGKPEPPPKPPTDGTAQATGGGAVDGKPEPPPKPPTDGTAQATGGSVVDEKTGPPTPTKPPTDGTAYATGEGDKKVEPPPKPPTDGTAYATGEDPSKPVKQEKVVSRETGKLEIKDTYQDGRVEVYDLSGKHLRTEYTES